MDSHHGLLTQEADSISGRPWPRSLSGGPVIGSSQALRRLKDSRVRKFSIPHPPPAGSFCRQGPGELLAVLPAIRSIPKFKASLSIFPFLCPLAKSNRGL